ncbi:hypothetical protein K491DRAFT_224554 [Lophiostoma macrostomum CBS 122681]|uniref:Myb-like domain-containing protein n=1 Tax=Lophiostoma macrostomum CBS 122681 TaxID=1314788 RepID=A0A6A6TGY0_9PLEO|nr:hypothetical protein K491DRAFT_224554 [Lophiostoma macrostomum CBS 122681]
MSASRYPDNSRYPRERSPYRDRRPSTYAGGYPPRGSESNSRPSGDSSAFPPRDVPRGPKSLVDAPRGPPGPSPSVPSGPRDGRGRGFAGRGDGPPSLRDAPPLTTATRDHWRAADRDRDRERERDRDRDFRDRRPSPLRRSPIRDSRDFPPNGDRGRRNSRDGPPSAGSTYSDPPLASGSSYRGSGVGRGRGNGRNFDSDFRPRGRGYHNDDRDRHHDARDARDRMYRPRSRSPPARRDRDVRDPRDDRDFDRRDRDERRFDRREDEPRRYDSYIGSASLKPGMRTLDTHRGSVVSESRNLPGTPTGPSPSHTHHSAANDRTGPAIDPFSRRSSIATEPVSAKDNRRDADKNELLASRAEFSKERYAPRASSPPAAVPAFGFSNVWRNPALDAKPTPLAQPPKPAVQATKPATIPAPAPVSAPAPVVAPLPSPPVPKPSIPSGRSTAPPTGPKAERLVERPQVDNQSLEVRQLVNEQPRNDPPPRPPPVNSGPANIITGPEPIESKAPTPTFSQANSPPLGPAARIRVPPTGPQAALRPNVSPSFSRPPQPPFAGRDASPGVVPYGPRNTLSINTSPKSAPMNIPTGPKADRVNSMAPRPPMYAPSERPPFPGNRMTIGGGPKSNQWVRPGLNRPPTIPSKREFPSEDRERAFGTAPKAPKLEGAMSASEAYRPDQPKTEPASVVRASSDVQVPEKKVIADEPRPSPPPKPVAIETRRLSDISMPDVSPSKDRLPMTATSPSHETMVDSDDDLDLDEDDFLESEAKYNREKALLESKRIDLTSAHLRAISPLQEIMLLSSLTLDHLPRPEIQQAVEEETMTPVPHPVQPLPESTASELLTPKDEEPVDIVMEEKQEKPLAPATRALRLRREDSEQRESTPEDLSSLPYLGSGPPTPLSDPDQDQPSVPSSVLLAMRANLQKEIAPEPDLNGVLQQYAVAYKNWRLSIRELDEGKEQEDPERQPSVEPGVLKATTPDIQSSSAMGPILDIPVPVTGRGRHSNRFATEFDLEQALKESLKTAEEERMGKKEREPKKSLWDPEREAIVPLELTAYEAQRRRFIDTNFQREPGQGIFVYHYEPPEDDFTEEEHKIMVQHYRDQYAKKWGKLAEMLYKEAGTSRTYKDAINHYYATKWGREYKGGRRGRGGPRGGRKKVAGSRRAGAANADRLEASGEDGQAPLALTDSGRPRRLAAPTFGAESEFDSTATAATPRQRRTTDVEGAAEKVSRRKVKEGRAKKVKNPQPLAAAPIESPLKSDRKERVLGVKLEDDFPKFPVADMPMPMQPVPAEDHMLMQGELPLPVPAGNIERPRSHTNSSRPGPSSYWSVTEQNDFKRYVAHFGTDWAAIANHMGTKTQTMVKNQYLRLTENGNLPDLARSALEADKKRMNGEELGPPPTPTPAPKRRYESSSNTMPRPLAPTPEINDLLKSPPVQPILPPKFSPPQPNPSARFPTIAQAPSQAHPAGSAAPQSVTMAESPLAALPSMPPSQPPPASLPHTAPQQHILQHNQPQTKGHRPPLSGYFSDDRTSRLDNRQPTQPPPLGRPSQQQIHSQMRSHEQSHPALFRTTAQSEREPHSWLESPHDREPQVGSSQHTRNLSRELPYHAPFQANAHVPPHMNQMRSTSSAASPENRPLALQLPRQAAQTQPSSQPHQEGFSQAISVMAAAQQATLRASLSTPPVKEEPHHYVLPQTTQPQPPPPMQSHPSAYPQPSQQPVQPPAPAPTPKPAEPRKSNLLSLLNDTEPEEPKRRKPSEAPSHTPTPQQHAAIAPPPPTTQALSQRRDPYSDSGSALPPYSRGPYAPQPPQAQAPSARQIVDLTNETSGRPAPRDNWPPRPSFLQGQGQGQPTSVGPSHSALLGNHRSLLAQHNTARHNPSPPPLSAYNNSPHMHSRTPSLSGPASQQLRHSMSSSTPVQAPQPAPGSSQILQPNPYAQVDPPGSTSQVSAGVGMRPSPHLHTTHAVQPRDMQSRNEQSQVHNANLPYSNSQTPSELHPAQQHLRGPSMTEHYRARDARDFHHDFDTRNHERDVSRELSNRTDAILRDREALMSRMGGATPSHQDLRYPHPPPGERAYPGQRSHTPISRSEHPQHPSLQHGPPHSMLTDGGHPAYGQRQQEEPAHRYRDQMRGRERELRDRELRDQTARYHDDLLRRDSRLPPAGPAGGPGHVQPGHEQRPPLGGPPDWTSAVRGHHEQQQQQQQQRSWQR